MPISFSCPKCGKKLKAPDSAAGKSSKCPQCGSPVTCPEPVYDAELVETPGTVDPYADLASDKPYDMAETAPAMATATEGRRPCPMCGEMIIATAAKCRFCGEVFDATIKRMKKGGTGGKAKMKSIASAQRNLIISILAQIVLFILLIVLFVMGQGKAPEAGPALLILCLGAAIVGAAIAGTVYAFMLAVRIHGSGLGILMGLLTFVPYLGFVVLLVVNNSATKLLRESGHHVGFLGADMSEF